jgi:hypothetical protein
VGSSKKHERLFLVDLASRNETVLFDMEIDADEETLYAPIWSPRGDEIAFVRAKWVRDRVDKFAKDILVADVATGKTAVLFRGLDIPADLGKGRLGQGVPYDVWALGWSPGGHDLVLSLIEPLMIPAGAIRGIDKTTFATVGVKALRPGGETGNRGINQDKILVIQRKAGLTGMMIMYGGHGAFVRGGVNWSLL